MAATATKKTASKRSGNPAKRAAAKVSSVADFKKRKSAGIQTVTLPSGLGMMVKRVELQSFITSGNVPNSLLPIVEKALSTGQDVDMSEIVGEVPDLEKIQDIFEMMGEVAIETSIEPKIHPNPAAEDEAEWDDDMQDAMDEVLFLRDLDEEDLAFLFQLALGGTADLEQFRGELQSGVASLAEGQGGLKPAKRVSRPKKR